MNLDTSGDLDIFTSPSGPTFEDTRRKHRIFRITSGTNPYAAQEIHVNDGTGAVSDIEAWDFTTSQKMLWELNGNANVPADTRVVAWPNPHGQGWVFDNNIYSLTTTVSGSGGVDLTTTYASCSSSYTLAPGKYHMTADLAFQTLSTGLDGSNYLNIKVRLYDVTNAVELSDRNPYVMNGYETGSVYRQGMFPYTEIIDVDASTQVRFEAKKVVTGSPTTTFCVISSGYVSFHRL